jgi:osmoprotectant transport system permease protein
LRTTSVPSLGSTVAFDALRNDQIDVYVDYSGTIWTTIMNRTDLPSDRSQVVAEVANFLEREHRIVLVASLGFENTYALAMRASQADALGVETLSDLVRFAPRLEIGGDYEFFARPEWKALVERYGFAFRAQRSMDSALMYQAAASEQVDVISAFSTDGRIAGFGLRLLVDDLGVIPPYDAIVLAGPGVARDAPDVIAAIEALEGVIDEKTMQRMNYSVDSGGEAPDAVATAFLASRVNVP